MVIYSQRPDLGMDLRLVHKGRVLRSEQLLSEANLRSGDAIAVARKAAAAAPDPAPTTACDATAPEPAAPATEDPGPAPAPPTAAPADMTAPRPAADAPATAEAQPDGAPEAKRQRQEVEEPAEAEAKAQAEAREEPATETACAASPQSGEAPSPGAEAPEGPAPMAIDATSAAGLLDFARSLEGGSPSPPPEQLARAMREASQKMAAWEGVFMDLGHALQVVNMVSGNSLREAVAKVGGHAAESPDAHPGAQESTRSFLLKRGDAETHELHRAALQARPANVCGGGTLSSSSAPLTKEEMDKARHARLAKLEEQQAMKQKEREEAEEKGKAREAMFNRQFSGPTKPLGKF